MKNFNAVFRIISEKNCPLYQAGEHLQLSEKTIGCPEGKEVCLILVRDMTQLLFTFLKQQPFDSNNHLESQFNCSGCSGLIKFALTGPQKTPAAEISDNPVVPIEAEIGKSFGRIVQDSFLQLLPRQKRTLVLEQFQKIQVDQDTYLIHQGKPNLNLYLVLSGEFAVEDNGIPLATLNKGEICGEMSYLGADLALASVKALMVSEVMAIQGDIFGKIAGDEPQLQTYMANLFAKRLLRNNEARSKDIEASMRGRIDEIVPAELFQIFNMHQKTGVLKLDLPNGEAEVAFREGAVVRAEYGGLTNTEAVYQVISEKSGWYRFTVGLPAADGQAAEVGDFMMLLMEGVKRADEEGEGK